MLLKIKHYDDQAIGKKWVSIDFSCVKTYNLIINSLVIGSGSNAY